MAIASPTVLSVDLMITNVAGISTKAVSWSNEELKVPMFDHNLGTLTQVRIDVVGNVRTTPKIENLTSAPRTLVFGSQATVVLHPLLGPGAPLVSTQPRVLITRNLGAFDGVLNYAADGPGLPSGISQFPQTGTDQKSVSINSSNTLLLSQFINNSSDGNARISLYASATGNWLVTGGALENVDFAQDIKTDAGINIYVIYTYTPIGYTLAGRIWNDINLNGIQDPGEPSIPGQLVTLLYNSDSFSEPVPVGIPGTFPQTTDANGRYQFTGFVPLDIGSKPWYSVQVATPTGFTIHTYSLFGLSPDPNIVRSTILLPDFLDSTLAKTDIDFGFAKPLARVSGTVWVDANISGVQDPGESGLAGIPVTLTNATGTVSMSTMTDSQGNYLFYEILGDGSSFTVTVAPPTFYLPTFDVDDGKHTTPGVGFSSPNKTSFPLPAGAVFEDRNFGYFGGGQLGDRVWNDLNADGVQDINEPGIAGVVVTLTGGTTTLTTTTDDIGYYTFGKTTVLGAGTYTVAAIPPPGYRQTHDRDDLSQLAITTPNSASVTIIAGDVLTDVDFGYTLPLISSGSIGDRVWVDTNGNGLQESGELGLGDVTVVLSSVSSQGSPVDATLVTDSNGFYSFTGLPAGVYQVTASGVPSYRATVPNPSTTLVTLAQNQHRNDVDFGFKRGSIGDLVWVDTNGNGAQDETLVGVPGAKVTISSPGSGVLTTNVTATGYYHFENLPPGTYTVLIGGIPVGYTQTTGVGSVTLAAGEDNSNVDFGFRPPVQALKESKISGVVWLDADGNGVQQLGGVNPELGLASTPVKLFKNNIIVDSTLTDGLGRYTFMGLEKGNYSVKVVVADTDLVQTFDYDDGIGPFSTPGEAFVILPVSTTIATVNFGYRHRPVNRPPTANAGGSQTICEAKTVVLNGARSIDPDGDTLTFSWVQLFGRTVTLSGANTATPTFTSPFVGPAGETLVFQLTVNDGFGGVNRDRATNTILNCNTPPDCSAAKASISSLWPPNHKMVPISIVGVKDPDNNHTITITSVTQDEPINSLGDGNTGPDAIIQGGTLLLRAERSGTGNGRVYHIHFTAADWEGSCSSVVTVSVPHDKSVAIDGGELFNSTGP